jgi:hypothetical protein
MFFSGFVAFLSFVLLVSLFPAPSRAQETFSVNAGSSQIEVTLEDQLPNISHQQLQQWIQNAADAVIAYYGRFPVPHLTLRVRVGGGAGVHGGRTFSAHGGLTRIAVGRDSTVEDLRADWMLTHEMVHLTFPSVEDEHHWIEEGIATYVEPIARVQAGQFSASRMWFEVVRDIPQGLPEAGDQGLDHTHTWGRTYWGGALFCFLADVEIRKQTRNKKGLQDALRGILDGGGDMREEWKLEKALQTGDRAVGVSVLLPLYEQMKDKSAQTDLNAIWTDLGIRVRDGKAEFDDSAALAAIRNSITAPFSAGKSSDRPPAEKSRN